MGPSVLDEITEEEWVFGTDKFGEKLLLRVGGINGLVIIRLQDEFSASAVLVHPPRKIILALLNLHSILLTG